jgi:hypothetical protein
MQSKRHTLMEVVIGTAIAFVISALFQQYVITPVWHLPTSGRGNLEITVAFTVLALFRAYYLRRLFNWLHSLPWYNNLFGDNKC